MYIVAERRIAGNTAIRRERRLPRPGEVLVGPGDAVAAADVVARCRLPGELHVVDVCRALSMGPAQAQSTVRVAVGDLVETGDLLAQPRGLVATGRRACRAPAAGRIVSVLAGLILLEAEGEESELQAHVTGRVERVLPERGVVIATTGALIGGVWGRGGEARGPLRLRTDHPQKPLLARSLDAECRGALVAGGQGLSEYVLEHAVKAGIGGLIVGSVEPELRSLLQSLPFPVLVTEGFGPLPMNRWAFALLQANEGRDASLSTPTGDGRNTHHAELVVPGEEAGLSPDEGPRALTLRAGNRVQCVRAPFQGQVGTVTSLPVLPAVVDSGLRLQVAEVELEPSERSVVVPSANLEIIC